MANTASIEEKLIQFGLNDIEAKLYAFLVRRQPQTILEISRQLKIPRTSVYDNSQKLIEKGLIERVVKYKSMELKASPPAILDTLLDKKKAEVDKLHQELDTLKAQLTTPLNVATTTQVRYFHGASGMRQMMWNATQAEKETVGYSIYGRVEIVGAAFMKRFVEEFIRKGLRDRVIVNPAKRTLDIIKQDVKPGKHQNALDDIRYLPESQLYVFGDTTIYNHTFAVAYWKQGEVVGVEIENPELVKTQKSIFELLWKQAKPVVRLRDRKR